MADKTLIEWTDSTWNPIRARVWETQADGSGRERIGWHCEHVSPGCQHCYAEGINHRLGTGVQFRPGNRFREDRVGYSNGAVKPFLDAAMLTRPLSWRRSRMIFVCSMTDLFADFVPDEWIDRVFAVMALCHQHTFQVLTKRPDRMRKYLADQNRCGAWEVAADPTRDDALLSHQDYFRLSHDRVSVPTSRCYENHSVFRRWPLPNVWLGVSVEDQRRADERIPLLLDTPSAVRWVSAEPLLGPVDLTRISFRRYDEFHELNCLADEAWVSLPLNQSLEMGERFHRGPAIGVTIDWVVAGPESGPNARPAHIDWGRSLRDQCGAAGVPFLWKQNGAFEDHGPAWGPAAGSADDLAGCVFVAPDGSTYRHREDAPHGSRAMCRVGKKTAGRLLDGVIHDGYPEARPHG